MSSVLATSRPRTPPRLTTRLTSLTAASMGALGMQARPGEALRVRLAEVGEPVVVDPDHLRRRLGIVHPRAGAEDAVEHLGLDAVAILVLEAQLRIAQAPDAALAVLVEAGGGHAVGAVDLAGHVLAAGRAHAVGQAEGPALLRHPHGALGPLGHVGHAVAHAPPRRDW